MTGISSVVESAIARLGGRDSGSDPASFRVSSIESPDGNLVSIPESGVTVVVGPNNSGKSTFLREIHGYLLSEPSAAPDALIVKRVETSSTGSGAQVLQWLAERHPLSTAEQPAFTSATSTGSFTLSWGESFLPMMLGKMHETGRFGSQLGPFLSLFLTATDRMQVTSSTPIRRFADDPALHPVHALEDDRDLLTNVQSAARDVFGVELTLDKISAERRLKVGAPLAEAPNLNDDLSIYSAELNSLPGLSEQGDGMRSFFGIILTVLSSHHPIILIDEPEAFLHPPQAKALGQLLGEIATTRKLQIFIATHDQGLTAGLLDSGSDLSIVRLQRTGDSADVSQIRAEDLRKVWAQPAMRYSSALNGLFHHAVVLVESEYDAQFYAATLAAAHRKRPQDRTSGDMLFIPCSGKGGMAKLARQLVTLKIPTVAVVDIDLLRDRSQTEQLVGALGGSWSRVSADFDKATSRMDNARDTVTVGDLKQRLGVDDDLVLDKSLQDQMRRYFKMANKGWQSIKDAGYQALGGGDVRRSALALIDGLDEAGVVLVKEGELEAFAADLGVAKGPKWFESAYEAGKHETEPAQELIGRVVGAARRS